MADILKKREKIINYLLRVKTKMKERRERKTRKAECTCVEKQTLSMTWLSMPSTQTRARINPCNYVQNKSYPKASSGAEELKHSLQRQLSAKNSGVKI